MTPKVKAHEADIQKILNQDNPQNVEAALSQHLLWVGFLQHERLIHLMITLFFAFVDMILVLLIAIAGVTVWWLLLITLIISILLLFYIWHYYFLENTVQRWYTYTDQLRRFKV